MGSNSDINVNQDIDLRRVYRYDMRGSYKDKKTDFDVDLKISEIFKNDEQNDEWHMFGFTGNSYTEDLILIRYNGTADNPTDTGKVVSKGDFVIKEVDGYSKELDKLKIMKSLVRDEIDNELTVEQWKDTTMVVSDGDEEFEVTFKLE